MLSLFVCLAIPISFSMFVLKGKSKGLIAFLLSGMFMCLFAGQLNGLIAVVSKLDDYTLTTSVTPVVEELLKTIPIIVLAFIIKTDRQYLLECALMVGLGFATLENAYILLENASGISFLWAVSRGLGSAMLHSATTLMVAYGISYCLLRKKTFLTGTYAMLLEAMILHGIYNMLVQTNKFKNFGIIFPIAVFLVLSVVIFRGTNRNKQDKES